MELECMLAEVFGMNINGYFGVRSLEAVVGGIKSMDSKAQIALFLAIGIAGYGYFKYGKGGNNNVKRKEARTEE
jgi:hypothetical protein